MTEQEKRNLLRLDITSVEYDQMFTGALVKEIVLPILNALDERDREVERYKESNAVLVISNNSREEENQRLRKALEFYSDEKNHKWKFDCFDDIIESSVMIDCGDIARQALAREGKG
jgi:hypothetical protein